MCCSQMCNAETSCRIEQSTRRTRCCFTGHLRQLTTRVTHILPVSDDGGSTAEIVRVLGGPAVGDIRSRCLRLADDTDAEVSASVLLAATAEHASLSEWRVLWCTFLASMAQYCWAVACD